ncbi:MAG: CoA ester lyase [Gordonia sp. (in: high G+C Gram-positive bacteria)]|nr:MAG: CoA ester lyase [Gordonia sp. (in: high G+C Gram-positive bacteria)]
MSGARDTSQPVDQSTCTTLVPRDVQPAMARSWLLVPALDDDAIARACDSQADVVVLDVEDGVRSSLKEQARYTAMSWMLRTQVWIRINDAATDFWHQDVSLLGAAEHVCGVILAKTETATQAEATIHELPLGAHVVPLIESAMGIENAEAIAQVAGVTRLAFGSGDYRRDTGVGASPLALAYPRARLVHASRLAGLPAPIDGPTLSSDTAHIHEATLHTAEMGMSGKLCLATNHASTINNALTPQREEIDWATTFIGRVGSDGARIVDGSDRPRLARAIAIMAKADAFGLTHHGSLANHA